MTQKEKLIEKIAEILHTAGLDAYYDYSSMGKSGEHWGAFRKQLAKSILDAGFIHKDEIKIDTTKCVEAMRKVPHALKFGSVTEIDWDWEYANLAYAIKEANPIKDGE